MESGISSSIVAVLRLVPHPKNQLIMFVREPTNMGEGGGQVRISVKYNAGLKEYKREGR